jgi:type IV pilus assembly protein PilO
MGDLVNQLVKLPQKVKLVIMVVVMIVIGLLYYVLGYQPKTQVIQRLDKEIEDANRKLIESKSIAANRDKLEDEVNLMNEKLKHALTLLPNESDIRGILRNLSVLANKIGIEMLFFKPGGIQRKGLFSEIPIELRLKGSYNEIAVYFDKIGKLSRIINIRDISMTSPTKNSNIYEVTINCRAVTFMSAGAKM